MPPAAVWTTTEETALVAFLVDNRAEAGDGGSFKNPTFQRATNHIAHLHERGPIKSATSTRYKWNSFKKIYRIIRAIQSVSGWVWDDTTGASITVDTASSWDDYVKKHPEAKPFRNKGWKHFSQLALIMPSALAGAHVFYPTGSSSSQIDDTGYSSSSEPTPPPTSSNPQDDDDDHSDCDTPPSSQGVPNSRKRTKREPSTPPRPTAKRVRTSHGAAALQSMSESLAGFGSAITAALAPPVGSVMDPSPLRRNNAIAAVLRLEAEWLTLGHQVTLIDFFRSDRTAADVYMALTDTDVRKEWVRIQLERLGITVFLS